ncbi:MAG: mandelate racemase [Alphaproteobacteria bacterium]|nr:mandelate racemase [Alphaproteobacteria bacterium]
MRQGATIEGLRATAYTIPTDAPEADGTLSWDSTTMVLVRVRAGGREGVGYSYAHEAAAMLIGGKLADAVRGLSAMDVPAAWEAMRRTIRNLGRQGLVAEAISAVDIALWDLKAKLLDVSLSDLLGKRRSEIPIYGSGGFTSYDDARLTDQLSGWVEDLGCAWVKMKVGTHPDDDPRRVAVARGAVGRAGLFVDGNGAYSVKQAIELGERFADCGVTWFEEPVTADDLPGLGLLRQRLPAGIEVAAGEYIFTLDRARRLLEAEAVDVMQLDATRCLGLTGFMMAAAQAEAHHVDLSCHCAPALHLHAACAGPRMRHIEWFHDHVRIEAMLFDGAPQARGGVVAPDAGRPGLGLDFKEADAERWRVH